MSNNIVQQGINYLRAMKQGNLNVIELAEELEIDGDHIKRCIKAARERKEAARKGFVTELMKPRYYMMKGPKGEFQTLEKVELEFDTSFTINYDTAKESVFKTTMPVIVRVKRY